MATANGNKKRKRKLSAFCKLRLKVGLDQARCADFCGVTVRTVQNWDLRGAPFAVERLLHMYDRQCLAGQGPGWAGWRFERGSLVNRRAGLRFGPRTLERLPYLFEVFARFERVKLRAQDGVGLDVLLAVLDGGALVGALPFSALLEAARLPQELEGGCNHG